MPRFAVIYIKRTDRTPEAIRITFIFLDGQKVDYESENMILERFTKESIIEKHLFPYIPFYIARYEKKLAPGEDIGSVAEELAYFRDELVRLHREKELSDDELVDLMGFVNTIITHIIGSKNSFR